MHIGCAGFCTLFCVVGASTAPLLLSRGPVCLVLLFPRYCLEASEQVFGYLRPRNPAATVTSGVAREIAPASTNGRALSAYETPAAPPGS
ncbi:hypothetical protein QBC34DRAFT_392610 [Podospora aff. communis PSN243]|uniref:Secreted protein n=1 Tax=Podospora aff. communis PSN243 TaxID=3040156 RepID=A0AAV9H453_9PEZI|nr:hypothetical protein QBC34DRAFT_392610 [Podospora aff. communis PSN243]